MLYGKLLLWMAQPLGKGRWQPALLPADVGGCCTAGVLGAAASQEMQMGLLVHVLVFFHRKMTISRNALKLSSRTLSSSTERSECVGCFF